MNAPSPKTRLDDAVAAGVRVLDATQEASGSWRSDYSGVLFLGPMAVGTMYAIGQPFEGDEADAWARYLRHTQREDGSWGLGVDNPGAVFTTTLSYVALRLLGMPRGDQDGERALAWIHAHGGPQRGGSWGRFFLALLGLYDWRGLDPVPPETWLLPKALPVFPGRIWCHARMVYLPMSWLWAQRFTVDRDPLLDAIRAELYPQGYGRMDWAAQRGQVAETDRYTPQPWLARRVHDAFALVDGWWPTSLRQRACDEVLERIAYEDEITSYRCIGPVNKLYDLLVWHAVGDAERVAKHLEVLPTYWWTDAHGTRMNGYDSSELWDTAFALQALHAVQDDDADTLVKRAHAYVDATQVREDPPDASRHDRCRSEGAWPFSTRAHGWPITDCTAEGLVAALDALDLVDTPIDDVRLGQAVDRLLEWQNPDGSWASYERTRGPTWLEALNPSDVFGAIMVDHGHTECTAASMRALARWRAHMPHDPRDAALATALAKGAAFLRRVQRPDGGWEGGWGVCFTYGTWFGVTGLLAAGVPADDPAIRAAVRFLDRLRLHDGGWGEHVDACRLHEPVPTPYSEPVQTAWAVMTLIAAGAHDEAASGVQWLVDHQQPTGRWEQHHETGVFNHTCSIHYDAYPRVFPVWALAMARDAGLGGIG